MFVTRPTCSYVLLCTLFWLSYSSHRLLCIHVVFSVVLYLTFLISYSERRLFPVLCFHVKFTGPYTYTVHRLHNSTGASCIDCAPIYRMLRVVGIPRMRCAFCRLRKSVESAEQIYITIMGIIFLQLWFTNGECIC